MKRSEMIEFIKMVMDDAVSKSQISEIIELAESKGMTPPTVKNPRLPEDTSVWQHADKKALSDLCNTSEPEPFYVNVWEQE